MQMMQMQMMAMAQHMQAGGGRSGRGGGGRGGRGAGGGRSTSGPPTWEPPSPNPNRVAKGGKTWVREEAAADMSSTPCVFFQQGSFCAGTRQDSRVPARDNDGNVDMGRGRSTLLSA